jgi:CheY-like chemotaxis protein
MRACAASPQVNWKVPQREPEEPAFSWRKLQRWVLFFNMRVLLASCAHRVRSAVVKTILIVEDTPDLQELFVFALREAGYDAVAADDGRQALATLESLAERPCLVLLDMTMPVMNGWEFVQALQQVDRWAALPIVALTAIAAESPIEGVRQTVKKPIDVQKLLGVVEAFCGPP